MTLEIQTNPAKTKENTQEDRSRDSVSGDSKQDNGGFELPDSLLE